MRAHRRHAAPAEQAFDALGLFRRALGTHLLAEEAFLKDVEQPGREELARFAQAQASRFADLVGEWSLYLSEWSEENIREDWDSFAKATGWIMGRLRDHMRMENDILYPLALRHGLIALRAEAA